MKIIKNEERTKKERRKNEERTKKERRKNEERTKKERRKNEERTKKERRKNEERTKKERRKKKERTKERKNEKNERSKERSLLFSCHRPRDPYLRLVYDLSINVLCGPPNPSVHVGSTMPPPSKLTVHVNCYNYHYGKNRQICF